MFSRLMVGLMAAALTLGVSFGRAAPPTGGDMQPVEQLESRVLRASTSGDSGSWWLIDADRDVPIVELTPGAQVRQDQLPTQHLNAEYRPLSRDVNARITVDGVSHMEGSSPFSVFGDSSGNFNVGSFSVGTHTLSGSTYHYPGWGSGTVVEQSSVTFSVTAPAAAASLVTAPWIGMDNKITLLKRDTDYVVPKGWGVCYAHNWTLDAEPGTGRLPQIIFQDPTAGAWLMTFASGSSGNTLRNFNVLTAPDVTTKRNGIRLGGSDNTLDNVGFGGGGDQLLGKDEVVKNLHLLNLRSIADVGGNFLYAGSWYPGRYTGFVLENEHIDCGMASVYGIAHPNRFYDIGNARLINNYVDVRAATAKYATQYPNSKSTSGLRLHAGTDGIHVQGGTYNGYQSWCSSLHESDPHLANVTFTGVTFGNSINVGDTNGLGHADNIVYDGCTFNTGASFALSLGPDTSGKVVNSAFNTTARTPIFDHTIADGVSKWTFSGDTKNGVAWR